MEKLSSKIYTVWIYNKKYFEGRTNNDKKNILNVYFFLFIFTWSIICSRYKVICDIFKQEKSTIKITKNFIISSYKI